MSQPEWWSPAANYSHNQPPARQANFYLPPSAQPFPERQGSARTRGARVSVGLAVGMALIAGAIGGVAGNLANGSSLLDSSVKLVATSDVVERAPESIAPSHPAFYPQWFPSRLARAAVVERALGLSFDLMGTSLLTTMSSKACSGMECSASLSMMAR